MKVKATSNGFRLPDPGEYLATLIHVENLGRKLNKFGKETEQAKLTFELDESGLTQPAWVNMVLSPNSKFYEIASALLARNPPDEVDTDMLLKRKCRIFIEHYFGQTDGKERAKITAYRIAPRQMSFPQAEAAAPPAAAPAQEEQEVKSGEEAPF
jgi:hypothetical protein